MTKSFAALTESYRKALLTDVIPFWEKHSIDRECGGYYTFKSKAMLSRGNRSSRGVSSQKTVHVLLAHVYTVTFSQMKWAGPACRRLRYAG